VYPRGGDIYEVSRFRRKKGAWRKLTWALTKASAVVCASAAMEELVREIFVWIPERLCAEQIEWRPVCALPFLLLIVLVLEQLGVTTATAEKTRTTSLVYNEHPALLRILPSPACSRDVGRVHQERRFVRRA